MTERLTPQQGRQGERGRPVLFVLLGSLALLAVAAVGLLTWNGANSPKDWASQSQDASRKEITGSVNGVSTPQPATEGANGAK